MCKNNGKRQWLQARYRTAAAAFSCLVCFSHQSTQTPLTHLLANIKNTVYVSDSQQEARMADAAWDTGPVQLCTVLYRHSWYIRMAPMYECSIGPSSTLGFSKVFFGLLFFLGIFRYLLIENSGILVLWYFSCNFICWCVWYYWQNSYISATLCTKNDGTTY